MRMKKVIFTNEKHIMEEYVPPKKEKPIDVNIAVNPNIKYQKHLGFGGALTDAACISFNYLPEIIKEIYLEAYFSKDGLNYNLLRYPLGSCDFSDHSYHYLNDDNLDNLSIECDKDRIAMYKRIASIQKDLTVFAVPWTPPSFMKDTNEMCHGGKLKPEYYDLYSKMLLKSVDLLRKEGLNIKVLNTQNEPLAKQVWESCIYNGLEESDFVSHYLMKNQSLYDLNDLSYGIWDHNRDVLIKRIQETFTDDLKPENVSFVCFHWYSNQDFEQLDEIHKLYPNLHLVMTEGCVELLLDKNKDNSIGDFSHAERYAHQMINDFNHYCEGYIDWNLSLDSKGGPNHVGNFCEAPVMISKDGDMKLMYSFHAIAHFSRYILPGAYRIESGSDNPDIEMVSYENPDKSLVCVIFNGSDNTHTINDPYEEGLSLELSPHTIYTIVYKK
jgi:glucosylceramidase